MIFFSEILLKALKIYQLFKMSSSTLSQKFQNFLSHGDTGYKQHQYDGVEWCVAKENQESAEHDVRGGFIADEMGLGKTIMMIGLMVVNFLSCRRTLVVLPTVLVQQWADEIYKTTGHRVLVFHGAGKKKITREQLDSAPIVLTTYGTVAISLRKIDTESDCLLHQVSWDRVVFDEAHHLRNKNSRFYGAKKLNTRVRWLISGTPIQNNRRDFNNMCSLLGLPATFYAATENIEKLKTDYILRRTKSQVGIEMPQLLMNEENIRWNNEKEKKFAQAVHNSSNHCSHGDKLKMMMFSRQTCILPNMLKNRVNGLIFDGLLSPEFFGTDATGYSSKMDSVLGQIVERKDNGSGKIVFCHFREEIDRVVELLKTSGVQNIVVFDARTSLAKRMKILKDDPIDVLVVQIQTGSEGLNLQTKFSEIYFVSPHWNPAVEQQAIARCHRIGQEKVVHVFKYEMDSFEVEVEMGDEPRTMKTLDQYIYNMHNGKREIAQQIIQQ
jgi:SNF2 family DNA or RNA helicase